MPQVVAIVDAVNAVTSEEHDSIALSCQPIEHERRLVLPSAARKVTVRAVHPTLQVGLRVGPQPGPVEARRVVLARGTKLARCHRQGLPLRPELFRARYESAVVRFDVPVAVLLIRALAGAHRALLANELVGIVRGPVACVPVVQPHVVEVVTVWYPHLAPEHEHPGLVGHHCGVAASTRGAVVPVKTAIAEWFHPGPDVRS